jgi:hypothetical protein
VYEAQVVAVIDDGEGWLHVKMILPGAGSATKLIKHADARELAYWCTKAGREAFRDITFAVFGEDYRWFEASIPKRDRNRMFFAIGRKIAEAVPGRMNVKN